MNSTCSLKVYLFLKIYPSFSKFFLFIRALIKLKFLLFLLRKIGFPSTSTNAQCGTAANYLSEGRK